MPIIIPGTPTQTANTGNSPAAQDARSRAIARMMEGTAPPAAASQVPVDNTHPVQNPSSVSPEEMGALSATSTPEPEAPAESVEGQSPNGEGAEPSEATKPKEEPLSAQYAQLARKERALRAEMQKLKAEREAFKAEREATKPAAPAVDQSQFVNKDRLAKDPLAVLSELGINYDKLTEMTLNGPSPEILALQSVIEELRGEITTLKTDHSSTKKTIEDSQQKSYQQALNHIRHEAKAVIASNPEFETIKTSGAVEDVVDLIRETFEQDGVLMTVEEAAKQVEDYMVEEALKYARLPKILKRLQPAPSATPPAQKQEAPKQTQQASKTLTNAVGTSRQLSARERAILAFKGELKS